MRYRQVGVGVMVKKIALEEHFLDPATEEYWRPTMVDVAPAKTAHLDDFSESMSALGKLAKTSGAKPLTPMQLNKTHDPAQYLDALGFWRMARSPAGLAKG